MQQGSPIRAILFLMVAVLAGGAAIVVLSQLFENYQRQIAEAQKPEEKVMVVVATRDLYQGVTITEQDLFLVQIPPAYLAEGVFLSPEHVVGRIPRERILANEFIRSERLADPESGIGLNAIIPRGNRALSIAISGGQALSGFLNPGNYVDLLVTRSEVDEEGNPIRMTSTLLQAMFVLAVNSRLEGETVEMAREKRGSQGQSVTLLVTSEQAEQIAAATGEGSITLALRNDLDVDYAATQGIDVNKLLGIIKKRPKPRVRRVAPPEPTSSKLRIIRGQTVEEQRFRTGN